MFPRMETRLLRFGFNRLCRFGTQLFSET
jgi:hypothetical protein